MSSDYLDGELSQCGAATVSRNILKCGPCASFINTLQATVSLLRSTPKEKPSPDFKQRIREQLESGAIDLALFPRASDAITPAPMIEIPVTINEPRAPHGEVLELVDHALNTHHFSLC
mgnify:FL=1